MSLGEQLDAIREAGSKAIPAERLKVMHAATAALQASGAKDRVAKAGDTLPAFELPNQNGAIVRSAELLAQGPLVLTIYRGVW